MGARSSTAWSQGGIRGMCWKLVVTGWLLLSSCSKGQVRGGGSRDRARVILTHEARRDGFWLARFPCSPDAASRST